MVPVFRWGLWSGHLLPQKERILQVSGSGTMHAKARPAILGRAGTFVSLTDCRLRAVAVFRDELVEEAVEGCINTLVLRIGFVERDDFVSAARKRNGCDEFRHEAS
jgi:hypothetical protein